MKLFSKLTMQQRIYAAMSILTSSIIFAGCVDSGRITPDKTSAIIGPDQCSINSTCEYQLQEGEEAVWTYDGEAEEISSENQERINLKPNKLGTFSLDALCSSCNRTSEKTIEVVAATLPEATLNLKFRNNSQDAFQLFQKSNASDIIVGTEIKIDITTYAKEHSASEPLGYKWTGTHNVNDTTENLTEPSEIQSIVANNKGSFTQVIETAGTYIYTLQITDSNNNTGVAHIAFKAGPANAAEDKFDVVVDAGIDQAITRENFTTDLLAKITNPDNLALSYLWTIDSKPEGSSPTIADTSKINTSFSTDKPGTYELTLTASSGDNSQSDSVMIIVAEVTPGVTFDVAVDAGTDQALTLTLLGENVTSPLVANITNTDNLALIYLWTIDSKAEGSSPTIADTSKVNTSFSTDKPGIYELTLTASSGDNSKSDSLQIVVTENIPPVVTFDVAVNAGIDQALALTSLSENVTSPLVAVITNEDNLALTYLWTIDSKPEGSSLTIADTSKINTSFSTDKSGTYELTLTASFGDNSQSDSLQIVVTQNLAPIANAGPDQEINFNPDSGGPGDPGPGGPGDGGEPVEVSLTASGSSDPEGENLSYSWSVISTPEGFPATLDDSNIETPMLTLDFPGVYELELTVSDGFSTDTDSVIVTATPAVP
jgi:hypothetical protein